MLDLRDSADLYMYARIAITKIIERGLHVDFLKENGIDSMKAFEEYLRKNQK